MAQLKLPHVDSDTIRELVRDVDLSRLGDLGDELRHLDLAEGIRHLDVEGLRHLADSIERPEVDLAELRDSAIVRRMMRALGRQPRKRSVWSSLPAAPSFGTTVIAGAVIVLAGAALGGLLAWLYQPGKGERRRTVLRRRLRRLEHRIRGVVSPG